MNVQLWASNYDPEPQGIGPLVGMLAGGLRDIGNDVRVVTAHPHYPEVAWGTRLRPYRETRAGIGVLRIPIWPGRAGGFQRLRQELSFVASQSLAALVLPRPDVLIATTPSLPALAPALAFARMHRIPWAIWLQDIVTDAAATTGQLKDGLTLRFARRFEQTAYRVADRVVVISETFRRRLLTQGVPAEKLERIFNPAGRLADVPNDIARLATLPEPQVLAMGNIGLSQGLEAVVDAFQEDEHLLARRARLLIAGGGVREDDVRARIRSKQVTMPGVFYGADFVPVLRDTAIGLITQSPDVEEFNFPSKLMTYLSYGIPVVASVRPNSETARVVRVSGGGWVTDSRNPWELASKVGELLDHPEELASAGLRGFAFAEREFAPVHVAQQFQRVIDTMVAERARVRADRGGSAWG
jgi:colanic acid biosynthesis glycosyl transferase WcaI